MSGPSRTTTESTADIRAGILSAAESCFEYYGFRKTTVDDIAKAAGISRTTVYRWFADRDALLMALIKDHGDELMAATRRHVSQFSAFEDILVEGMLFQIEYGRQDLFWKLLVSPEYMDITSRLILSSEAALDVTRPLWEPLIEEGQRRGDVRPDLDPHEGCRWIVCVNVIVFSRTDVVPEGSDDLRTWIRQFVLPAFTIGTRTESDGSRRPRGQPRTDGNLRSAR